MIYALLRGVAGVALRWYYADVTIERDPLAAPDHGRPITDGPLLVVVNHPNALVDVLVAGRAVPRRLLFTAKSTLFANPVSRTLLSWLGVLPLRRASDEAGGPPDPSRNAQVFDAISRALANGGAVLIFPEGKSHDEPAMSPLRTGVARIALDARDAKSVKGLRVLPVGLTFQRKETPRSRILAVIGDALELDSWTARTPDTAVADLTAEIEVRLRAITLNYETADEAGSQLRLARQIAALIRFEAPSIGTAGDLRQQVNVARLLPAVRDAVRRGPELEVRSAAFESALNSFQRSMDQYGVSLDDVAISRGTKEGAVFVLRETLLVFIAGPIALWGWINHVIPFRAALVVGRRTRVSAADPAMRTIVAGTAFVFMVYALQGAAVALFAGPWWALAYVLGLPMAADVNLRLRDRLRRALRRARTYVRFRAHPEVHQQLQQTARNLRREALELADLPGISGPP